MGDTIIGNSVLGLELSVMEDQDNRWDREPGIRSRSLTLELALELNLELDSERQAGPACFAKERENRPYMRKLAERETRDETLRDCNSPIWYKNNI